jgi:segregation and condensation protein A
LSYLVHLQQFEGPLGLLLYLIRKEEMDIFDINVGEITRQYLDYIRLMKELDLEVAGEFVAMAATLIHIKSRMLLPQYDDQGEVVEAQDDPRKELVQKLLDYQIFQQASKELYERPLLGRDVFRRGLREDHSTSDSGEIITEDDGLYSLIAAYRRVVRKAQRAVHKVRPKVQSISMRIMEIKDRLILGSRVLLRDLIHGDGDVKRAQLLITFLSMLELGRMGFVSVFQSETYGDIHIDLLKVIDRNVLERVQEFDSADFEATAEAMLSEANEVRIDLQEIMAEAAAETAAEAIQTQLVASDEIAHGDRAQLDLLLDTELGLEALEAIADHELAPGEFTGLVEEGRFDLTDAATDEEILAAERELDEPSATPAHLSQSEQDPDGSPPATEAQA